MRAIITALLLMLFGASAEAQTTTFSSAAVASFTACVGATSACNTTGSNLYISAVSSGQIIPGEALSAIGIAKGVSISALTSNADGENLICKAANTPCVMTLSASVTSGLASAAMSATDCDTNITVSNGGLTVTGGATGTGICRAGPLKNSGKWYFEATPSSGATSIHYGFANNASFQPVQGGGTTNPGFAVGTNTNTLAEAGFGCGASSVVVWDNQLTTAGAGCANSQTIGFAVDLDANPPQFWATPNVASLICNGSGSAGSTNPQWNGSCANDPSIAGTGGPSVGGVHGIWLPGYGYAPLMQPFGNGNSATFDFGATAFAGTAPGGFSSWNTAGGNPSPGPRNPQLVNIANAPGWQQSHAYVAGDRVVAGPGWTAGAPGSYTSGSNLYLWALTAAGTSSAIGNGPQTCGVPANTGGGLDGSIPAGWSGATTASDGGVTWVCLSPVDYVTETAAFSDTAMTWITGTSYVLGSYVTNAGHIYVLASVPSGTTCTTGASAPVGAVLGTGYSDGTCTWTYHGEVTYSSTTNRWPHELDLHAAISHEMQFNWNVTEQLWYGGKEQQVYQPGANGETKPILMDRHNDLLSDNPVFCMNAYFGGVSLGKSCNGTQVNWRWTLAAAPGDALANNIVPASQPLRVDRTKGVTLFSSVGAAGSGFYGTQGEPLGFSDGTGTISAVQMLSTAGPCIAAHSYGAPGGQHVNDLVFNGALLDCASGAAAVGLDSGGGFYNSAIVFRGTTANSTVFNFGYPNAIVNNTIICTGGTNITVAQQQSEGAGFFSPGLGFFPPPFYNNMIIGCRGWAVATAVPWSSTDGSNNATDQASGYSATFTGALDGVAYTGFDFPGVGSTCGPPGNASTCFGLTPSQMVTNPAIGASLDLRIPSTASPIYGGGGALFFPTSRYGALIAPLADIVGNVRPTSGRYDVGAAQFATATSPPNTSGGRLLLR